MKKEEAARLIIEYAEDLIHSHIHEMDDDAQLSIQMLKDAIHDYRNGE